MSDWPGAEHSMQQNRKQIQAEIDTSGDCLRVKPNKRQTAAAAAGGGGGGGGSRIMTMSKTKVLSSRHVSRAQNNRPVR